jgi:hypothetical protein
MNFSEGIIAGLPLYNEDPRGRGDAVEAAVKDADALLFATPEFNYGMPGVFEKCDRRGCRGRSSLSRFDGKPVAMPGAGAGWNRQKPASAAPDLSGAEYVAPRKAVSDGCAGPNPLRRRRQPEGRSHGKYIVQLMQALYGWTLRLKAAP